MSRRRSISTDISTDPKLAEVAEEYGPLPLLLYTWAIPHASDFGQITTDPTQFRLLVCPALPVKSSEVACAIQQLVAAGLWRREGKEGREYLQFPEDAWFRHQSYINASKRPNAAKSHAPAEQQQETPRNAAKQQGTPQKAVSPSPTPSLTPSPSPTPPPTEGAAHEMSEAEMIAAEIQAEAEIAAQEAKDAPEEKQATPSPKPKRIIFDRPTEPECLEYFILKSHPEYSERFWNYWESVGWKRAGKLMVDWQAAARQWIAEEKSRGTPSGTRSLAVGSNKPGGMTIEDRKNETLAALRAG